MATGSAAAARILVPQHRSDSNPHTCGTLSLGRALLVTGVRDLDLELLGFRIEQHLLWIRRAILEARECHCECHVVLLRLLHIGVHVITGELLRYGVES